jgi:uracil-DNA glycosylase
MRVLVTVHPSFLLRVPPEAQDTECAKFVADLKVAAAFLRQHA